MDTHYLSMNSRSIMSRFSLESYLKDFLLLSTFWSNVLSYHAFFVKIIVAFGSSSHKNFVTGQNWVFVLSVS